MRRFKTKFYILILAFFIGIIAYKGYWFVVSRQVNDQIIEKQFISDTKEKVAQEDNSNTIEPCKEDIDTSAVIPAKKESKQSNVIEGNVRLENVNSLVLCGNLPNYPDAIKSKVSGLVNIEVYVDKTGKVISAKAIDGHDLLLKESIEAALHTRFSPFFGRHSGPFYFSGILTYEFKGERGVRLYKPSGRL
jgi:hypothetical protein